MAVIRIARKFAHLLTCTQTDEASIYFRLLLPTIDNITSKTWC